jgi:hypothetical protein
MEYKRGAFFATTVRHPQILLWWAMTLALWLAPGGIRTQWLHTEQIISQIESASPLHKVCEMCWRPATNAPVYNVTKNGSPSGTEVHYYCDSHMPPPTTNPSFERRPNNVAKLGAVILCGYFIVIACILTLPIKANTVASNTALGVAVGSGLLHLYFFVEPSNLP